MLKHSIAALDAKQLALVTTIDLDQLTSPELLNWGNFLAELFVTVYDKVAGESASDVEQRTYLNCVEQMDFIANALAEELAHNDPDMSVKNRKFAVRATKAMSEALTKAMALEKGDAAVSFDVTGELKARIDQLFE